MKRRFVVAGLAAALALALGACGGQKDTGFNNLPSPKASGNGGGSPTEIKLVAGNTFSPAVFDAKAGTPVVWHNADSSQPHNVVSDDGLFDSNKDCLNDQTKCMAPDATFTYTFTKAGEYKYYCAIHGAKGGVGMAGTVKVS